MFFGRDEELLVNLLVMGSFLKNLIGGTSNVLLMPLTKDNDNIVALLDFFSMGLFSILGLFFFMCFLVESSSY